MVFMFVCDFVGLKVLNSCGMCSEVKFMFLFYIIVVLIATTFVLKISIKFLFVGLNVMIC